MFSKEKEVSNLCPLCKGGKHVYYRHGKRIYYQCEKCDSIFLDENYRLTPDREKKRYLEHNNDVNDNRYQNFVEPITSAILNKFKSHHTGLDYGAGTGPVITKILKDYSYNIKTYDPYFHNYPEYLKKKYDYIACCEVIEHFYNPYSEFKKLKNMVKKTGALYCQTNLYNKSINFKNWYYKNDPTHVFFYTEKSIFWIKENFAFHDVTIDSRLIIFWN
jgi:hypothetical protein